MSSELHPRLANAAAAGWAAFSLADAQLVVARWYGFASWRRLREHLDMVSRYSRSTHLPTGQDDLAAEFLRLACLTHRLAWGTDEHADDLRRHVRARELLAAHPNWPPPTFTRRPPLVTWRPPGPTYARTRHWPAPKAARTAGRLCSTWRLRG
jgi:hypothetical protein